MTAARHKSERHMRVYVLDCVSRWESEQLDRYCVGDSVSKWKSIGPVAASHLASAKVKTTPDTKYKKPLVALAKWWFTDVVCYPSNAPTPDCKTLFEYALASRGGASSPSNNASIDSTQDRLQMIYSSTIMNSAEKQTLARSLLTNFQQSSLKVLVPFGPEEPGASLEPVDPSIPRNEKCNSPPSTSTSGNPKSRIRGGDVEITERKAIGSTKQFEAKYTLICTVRAKYESTYNSLRASDQTFYYSLKRLVKCVSTCHEGDAGRFHLANPRLALSKFKCSTCA